MRTRLFAGFMLVVFITAGAVIVLANFQAVSEIRRFATRGGIMGLDTLVETLEDYHKAHDGWDGVADIFDVPGVNEMMHGQPGAGPMRSNTTLADANGVILLSPGRNAGTRLTPEQMDLSIALRDGDRTVGYLFTGTGARLDTEVVDALVQRLTTAAWTAAALAGLFSIILASGIAYAVMQPVRALTAAAAKMAAGDLSQRVPVKSKDEIGALARAFNHMAQSLETLETNRKAMTADIAHELRTPLAVQRANIEALQDGIYTLDVENLAPLLEQNVLLERLVEDLRTLALADAGRLTLDLTSTELPRLAARMKTLFEAQAAAQGITIETSLPETCPEVLADPGRLEQVLTNLLTNALRHTPPGGKIQIAISPAAQQVHLHVTDSGQGIPEEALPHVFERFYRADKSRSRAEGGTGLGLAIARRIVEAHGGQIHASNVPGGGARFSISLPIPTA